jgi:hypothetical protein
VAELAGLPVWLGALAIATGRDVAGVTALTIALVTDSLALWPAPRAGANATLARAAPACAPSWATPIAAVTRA